MVAQLSPEYIRIRPSKVYNRLVSYLLFEGRPLTTRGRWINPLVFSLFSLEKKLPPPKKVQKPIYIVGTGRSGTTILGVILSMHKDVGFLNEPKALWHAVYPYEDLIGNYTSEKAFYRLTERHVDDVVYKNVHRLYGWYLTFSLSTRVVDKYPEMIFRVPFIKAIFPDAKFLFLVRNGKNTCLSIKAWSERLGKQKGNEVHDWWGLNDRKWHFLVDQIVAKDDKLGKYVEEVRKFNNHLNRAAVEWIVTVKEGIKLLDAYPKDVMLVKYEDLVLTPEKTLKKICSFAELRDDETFMKFAKTVLKTKPRQYNTDLKLSPVVMPSFVSCMERLGYEI